MFLNDEWVRPFWLERQIDPTSADFVPGGLGSAATVPNLTRRSGTRIGTVSTYARSLVDPRGLIVPFGAGWSLDWWIGAEDRWHLPSRPGVLRQRLLADAPVIETALRVPGGDAIHRAYVMHHAEIGPCTMIEIENRTAVPFAVALSVRPYDLDGAAPVRSISSTGAAVVINDSDVVSFSREPAHVVLSRGVDGDAAATIFAGQAGMPVAGATVVDPDDTATAAFVFPLPHTAILRVAVPIGRAALRSDRRSRSTTPRPAELEFPDVVPTAEQVAKGWEVQTRRGLSIEIPDVRVQQALDTARRHLLVAHRGADIWSPDGVAPDLADTRTVLRALDQFGFAAEARRVLSALAVDQSLDGTFAGAPGRMDANGAVLDALAEHWRLTRDPELIDSVIGPVAKAVHRIERNRVGRRSRRSGARTGGSAGATAGVLPSGSAPVGGGPDGAYLADVATSIRGLDGIADALDATGQPEVAQDARRFAASLQTDLDASVASCGDGEGPIPATAARRPDAGIVANLALMAPFGAAAPTDDRLAATLDRLRETSVTDHGVLVKFGNAGFSPALTMQLALVELEAGDRRALDRLGWMLEVGGHTVSWPTTVHPRSRGGATGVPHDPLPTALFLTFVRRLLVREIGEIGASAVSPGLALCSMVPDSWLGQSIDVRDAPTAFGTLSFSIRWHGDRPALLWQVDPHDGVDEITLTVPGLDLVWSSTEWSGEALLGRVVPVGLIDTEVADGPDHDGHEHDGPDHEGHDHGVVAPALPDSTAVDSWLLETLDAPVEVPVDLPTVSIRPTDPPVGPGAGGSFS